MRKIFNQASQVYYILYTVRLVDLYDSTMITIRPDNSVTLLQQL